MTQSRKPKSKLLLRLPPESRPPLRLQERDKVTIEEIYRKRVINTKQIVDLVSTKTLSGKRNIEKRLHPMFHHGFVDRPTNQARLLYEHQQPTLYTIGPAGAQILREMGYPANEVKMQLRANLKDQYLEHLHGVGTVQTYLDLGLRYGNWRLSRWALERDFLKKGFQSHGDRWFVKPDGLAFFEHVDGVQRQAAFIEYDNNDNVSLKRMKQRYESYYLLRLLELHKEQPFCIPASAFRVITVVAIPPRVEADKQRRAQRENARLEKLIHCIRSSEIIPPGMWRIFWFVMGHQFLDSHYRSMTDPIFQTPKSKQGRKLFE